MAWFEHGSSRIYYEEHGSGDAVLLLPGFAGQIEEFATLKDALAPQYRIITADLPGSGRSEPQPRPYPITFYEEDARSVAALLGHLGTGSTHLVGSSDGGEVSLLMAALTPSLTRSVVTWGAAGTLTEEHLPLVEVISNVIDNPIEQVQPFSDYLKATYGESNARTMTQSYSAALRAIIKLGSGISVSHAKNIRCPVLLIAGQHDFMMPPALVSELAEQIPTAEMLEVQGAGHNVFSDRPDWLILTLRDWLEKH